ncbi:MAG: LysR family transcriptional regulator [Gammaproteobacteria bacterium]|nr:LysR family transcriptional regulator [Gammaproteobacteria bacterium]
MNWDYFRYLLAIAEEGSVSRAAQQLGVSHATVLRAVKRMEKDLGTRLFDHIRTGYRLTAAGEAVLVNARAMSSQVTNILRQQRGRDSVPAGDLRLMVPDFSIFNLMPLLSAFNETHEQINLHVIKGDLGTPDDLLDNKIDIALAVTNSPPDEMIGRQLRKLEFLPMACNKSPERGRQVPLNEWIHWGSVQDNSELQELQLKVRRRFKAAQVVMTTSNHDEAVEAVRAGVGVACLSSQVLENNPDCFSACHPASVRATHKTGLWVLTHTDLRSSGRVGAFLGYCSEAPV